MRGNFGTSPQLMMYRGPYRTEEAEGQLIKTTKGGVAYWLLGGASVVLATWQFALMVSN